MAFSEISTENAPTGQGQGVSESGNSTDEAIHAPSVVICQEPATEAVAAWFTTHRDRLIPAAARGFSYKREQWGWITQRNTDSALAEVVAKGAMYRTTCGTQTEPLSSDDEKKDRKNLAALRFGHMPWDFDAPGDVGKARDAAVTLVHELLPKLGIQPSQVYIWLSGSKGFHVDIPDLCIGAEAGDRLLPLIHKRMAVEIASGKIKYDDSMYCMGKGKQYRLPNVKRTNGLHKIALTADELKNMPIEDMQELAKTPRLLPLAPLTTTPSEAPIREMFLRHKDGVWHDELKPKKPPLTLDDKERFASKQFACMKYMAEEQDGYAGVSEANVNAYCAMLIAPEQSFFDRDPEDTEDLYGDCIMRCYESGSYPTPEDRLDKLRAEIRVRNIRVWSCGAAHKYLPTEALKCGECIHKQLEASTVFSDMPYDLSAIDKRADEELKREMIEVVDPQVDAVIQLMQSGPDKELFDALFRRGKRLESSFEVSDARLCQLIAFYAGSNLALVDAIYRRSSLMRPYWDTGIPFDTTFSSYAEETLNNACLLPRRYDPAKPDECAFPEEQKKVHRLLTGADILAMQFDNPPLIDGLLDEGESLGILGANGLGKSLAVLDIALSLADPKVEKLWGRYRKTRPLKLIIFQSEVTSKALKKRLTIMAQERPEVMELIKQLTFPSFGVSGRIAGSVTDDTFYGLCRDGVMKVKPDVIVFDPLISYHDGNENDPREMRGALDRITRLQDETGTACILTHHLGENSSGKEVFKGRGSSAIGDWLANIMLMEKAEGTSIKEPLIKVTPCKARNFELTSTFYLQRTPGLHLVPTAGPESADAQCGKEAVTALKAMGGAVAARARLVEYLEEGGASESTAKRWVTAAVSSGQIKVVAGQGRARGLTLGSAVEEVLSEAF